MIRCERRLGRRVRGKLDAGPGFKSSSCLGVLFCFIFDFFDLFDLLTSGFFLTFFGLFLSCLVPQTPVA